MAAISKDPAHPAILKMVPEKELATELVDRVAQIVTVDIGESWFKKTNIEDGKHIRVEDRKFIIIGLALRMSEKEILRIVNEGREKDNQPKLMPINLYYYRVKYAEIVDQVYATVALRIGETYRFADKIFRISRYNELAEILFEKSVDGLKNTVGGPDDMTVKLTNLYLKTSDKINQEMGGKSLLDHFKPHQKKDETEIEDANIVDKNDVEAILQERYGAQLPKAITQKIEFTDFTNCVQGEKMGDIYACFNGVMTKNDRGSMCAVQRGEIQLCPKFINRSLVTNREWLMSARERYLTVKDMIVLAGCTDPDKDSFDRMVYHLKNQDVFKHKPQDSWVEKEITNGKSEPVITSEAPEIGEGTREEDPQ